MTKTRQLFVGLTFALASSLAARSAYAANDHSWVASTGSGHACTRAAPCSDGATAQGATNPGGVISVLDPGDYFVVIITKSLTIRGEGVDGGGWKIPDFGSWIFVQAGATDVVTLEGLHLNGVGIEFDSGGHLHVVKCVITNDNIAGQAGIRFQPNSASRLSVTDTVVTNFGSGTGGGTVIHPPSGRTA